MNTVQILDVLAEAIEKRPRSTSNTYHICYLDHAIQCHPTNRQPTPEIIFGTFSDYQHNQGFTEQQWLRLAGKIQTFFRQKGIA